MIHGGLGRLFNADGTAALIGICHDLVVRDPDGLIRPLCFTHAVRRAMAGEFIDRCPRLEGKECWDCRGLTAPDPSQTPRRPRAR